MSTPFDPYYKWLGIPPAEQPPNHYRLLGVTLFEADRDVIETAADGRMALLRSFHTGPNSDASQQLLNEVAAAKLCLLKPDRRSSYDEALRQRLGDAAPAAGGRKIEDGERTSQNATVSSALNASPSALSAPKGGERKNEGGGIADDDRLAVAAGRTGGAWKMDVAETPSAVRPPPSALATLSGLSPPPELPKPSAAPVISRAKAWDMAVAEACAAQTLPRRRRRWQISPHFAQLVFGSLVVAGLTYAGLAGFTMWQESEFKRGTAAPPLAVNNAAPAATASDTTVGSPSSTNSNPAPAAIMPSVRPPEASGNFGEANSTSANFDSSLASHGSPSNGNSQGHGIGTTSSNLPADHGTSSALAVRSPVPSVADQQKATQLLKEVLKAEYQSAKGVDGQLALAHRLAELANQTADDPAARYVAASQALDIAVKLCDVRLASDLVGGFSTYYEIDAWELRAKTLVQLAAKAHSADARAVIASAAFDLVERALADDRGDAAFELATLTMNLANAARDIPLREQARKLSERAEKLRQAHKGVDAAQRKLVNDPNDPDANLAVGRYKCLVKQDWQAGLPFLAKGSDEALRALAQWELAPPLQAVEQVKLADAWWDLAELRQGAKDNSEEKALRERAAYWYRLAMPGLSGVSLAKAQTRSETQ